MPDRVRAYVRLARVPERGLQMAVVGHVEWVQFGHVARLPTAGAVEHATDAFEEPAGGGAVAAVALARLAGSSTLLTALGADEQARLTLARLGELGVEVRVAAAAGCDPDAPPPTRRAVTLIDAANERSITTFGARLDPVGDESERAWDGLSSLDGTYFTAGDVDALRRARAASRVLVASPRARGALGQGVPLDALVLSAHDPLELEAAAGAEGDAELVVETEGEEGGRWRRRDGTTGRWPAAPVAGKALDTYGCGDTFAAAITYALAAGMDLEPALELAARAAAHTLTLAGPYGRE
jgi:ribokinase